MLSPAWSTCSTPSSVSRNVPCSIARYSREPGACGANSPASTPAGIVVRISSNSTPGRTGERICRSQPDGSCAMSCSPRRSTTTRDARSSPSSRATLVSRPVAMRSSTSTVGTLLPRSTSESMLRLTPVRASRSWSERRRRRRSRRRRAPSPTISSPDDSLGFAPPRGSAIANIILYGGRAPRGCTDKKGGAQSLPLGIQCRCRLQPGRADPAGLGDVDGDAVRRRVLDLDVAGPVTVLADAERFVDVVAGLGAGVLQPLGDRLQALHLKADVMDAAPARAALDAGDRVVLEVQDRQVQVAVAEVIAAGAWAVDLRDLLHAEHVDVELRGLVYVLGREGDVLDLRHAVSPVEVVRAPSLCLSRQVTLGVREKPGQ